MGKEAEIKTQVSRRRESQLAAQIEGMGVTSIEMLTYSETDKVKVVRNLIPWLSAEGVLVLAETIPRHTQRLYDLLQPGWLPSELWEKLKLAESAIYEDNFDPMVNWDSLDLQEDLEKAGLTVKVEQE